MSTDSLVTRSKEDYLEIIFELSKDKGFARMKDVATKMGVKPASVTEMVKKLDDENYLKYEKYGYIMLTKKGNRVAEDVILRHEILKNFLEIILVPEEAADKSACFMEHNLDAKTVEQIKRFVEFSNESDAKKTWISDFEKFCKKKEIL